jgi:PAS domain S-box-containing protein
MENQNDTSTDHANQDTADTTEDASTTQSPDFTDISDEDGADAPTRFKFLFDSLPDAVAEVKIEDGEPTIHGINKAFADTFGHTEDEIRGRSLNEVIVPEGDADTAVQLDELASNTYTDRVVTRATADGESEFLYRGVPFERDGTQYAFAVYTDITEQKEREKQLEQKSKEMEEFASILSHDIRNPVNIAQGYLNRIGEDANQDSVERIERSLARIEELIDDTLTITRESGAVEDPELVEITELVQRCWELTETGDAELCIADEFKIECDADRATRLFENLFRNAIDHNDTPVTVQVGIHNTMTTNTRGGGREERAFYVQDNGSGIPKMEREDVLKLGETTARDGTGLGLPIVERVAEAHDWRMKLGETTTGGAKFVFSNVNIE